MDRPILITAGATRNPIDSMRSITANSSGATGVHISQELQNNGRTSTLMGSNVALLQPNCPSQCIEFTSTRDLLAKMKAWTLQHPVGIIVHTAAVGDFEVRETNLGKISSGSAFTLNLQPTPKIVDHVKRWSPNIRLVSFKAAAPKTPAEELKQIAFKQLQRTQSNLVFANVLGKIEENVLLLSNDGSQWFQKRQDGLDALIEAILEW